MSTRALGRRLAEVARRQAEAAERHAAATAVVDADHQRRVASLMIVPEDLWMAVGIALCDPVGDDALHSWAAQPFTRWATIPAGFQFPRSLVEWLLSRPHRWFLGHTCERCGLGVPLLSTWSNDPNPPPTIVVFSACPACGRGTSHAANWYTEPPKSDSIAASASSSTGSGPSGSTWPPGSSRSDPRQRGRGAGEGAVAVVVVYGYLLLAYRDGWARFCARDRSDRAASPVSVRCCAIC